MSADLTHVLFEIRDGIARITLNRPEARNALSEEMREDLDYCLDQIRDGVTDESVKAVIVTGEGKSFCAGGDVKGMADPKRKLPANSRARMRKAHNRLHALFNIEIPVIAAVNGHAAGAGFGLALLADFIVASPSSRFACSFGKIGLVPDWALLYTLPRIVGMQKAKDLIYTGRTVGPEEAKKLGFVYEIASSDDQLLPAAEALAERFTHASPHSIGVAKAILNQSHHLDHRTLVEMEAFAQGSSYTSPYHMEATRRFKNKEPAMLDWERMSRDAAE